MAESPTTGELLKRGLVSLSDVNNAVGTFLANPTTASLSVGAG